MIDIFTEQIDLKLWHLVPAVAIKVGRPGQTQLQIYLQ